jgi:hypothetical protein
VKLVRYADRPELTERRERLSASFPTYMQLHSVAEWDGSDDADLPSRWDEAFTLAFESEAGALA